MTDRVSVAHERSARQSVRGRRAVGRRQDQPDTRVAGARTRHPPVGVVHDARAAARRAGRRRLPLRLHRSLRGAQGRATSSWSTRTCTATGTRPRATWLKSQVSARPGRVARNRLARRRAGAHAHPRIGAHLHPSALARIAERTPGAARTGRRRRRSRAA